jgi:transcriptional regulator with XRE-family HTH domain
MVTESFEGLPLAELVARERHRRSLSLADVAALVRRAAEDGGRQSGATRQTAHNWERGQVPRPDSLRWLARALGIPTENVADAAARQIAMKRRELLRGAALVAGGLALPDHRSAPQTSGDLGAVMLAATELDEPAATGSWTTPSSWLPSANDVARAGQVATAQLSSSRSNEPRARSSLARRDGRSNCSKVALLGSPPFIAAIGVSTSVAWLLLTLSTEIQRRHR